MFFRSIMAVAVYLALAGSAQAATYYVRTDGGSSTQCTGLADTGYSGSGTNQACAFSHPFWVLSVAGAPNKMVGGDTLIIGPGEYQMGLGAPNTPSCSSYYPWDCYMRAIPSGTTANPTKILGKGWDTGCTSKPQLWGTERAASILNLQGSNNVEVQCLEVTDHSSCIDNGPDASTRCNRTSYPYGEWAMIGIVASDSQNVLIKNVNIHGLRSGIMAGRLTDWTIEKTDIVANSFVGWDGDIGATTSSNSGYILFKNSNIKWNGCGETYPGLVPHHCYSQDQGGYGDGIGTHQTGGDWVFDHVDLSYNVSDGLDLLYHNGNGSITISHSRFEGNAGNQVKVAANTAIDNSKIIGDCAFFQGKSFTATTDTSYNAVAFNNCRAGGNTIAVAFTPGMQMTIYNSTITSNGDVIIQSGGTSCIGTEKIVSKNNIYIGGPEYNSSGADTADLYYSSGATGNGDGTCGNIPFNTANDIIWATKYNSAECSGTTSQCVDPKIAGTLSYGGADQDVSLLSTSPAIAVGTVLSGITTTDYNNFERGTFWDIGALEYGSVATTADSSSSPSVPSETVTAPPSSSTTTSTSSSSSSTGSTSTGSSSTGSGSSGGSSSGSGSTGSSSSGSSSTDSTSSSAGSTSGSSSTTSTSTSSSSSSGSSTSTGSSTGSTWGGSVSTATATSGSTSTASDSSAVSGWTTDSTASGTSSSADSTASSSSSSGSSSSASSGSSGSSASSSGAIAGGSLDSSFGDINFEDDFKASDGAASISVASGPANGYIGPSGGGGAGLGSYLKAGDWGYKTKKSLKKGAKGYSLRGGLEAQLDGNFTKVKRSGWWTK